MHTALPIALQLWTVKEAFERDPAATLREVRRIGYSAVELAGFGGISARALADTLQAVGLRAISAHVPLSELTTQLPTVIADLQTINCQQAVLPWIPPEQRASVASALHLAEQCNAIGAQLAAHGIAFAYHNEDYDFLPLGATTLWQLLVTHTNAQFVALQLDVFTAILAGCDLPMLLRKWGPRITSLHVCDMHEQSYVPIGTGVINWQAVLQATSTATQWLIVEQDGSTQPFVDAHKNLLGLQNIKRALDK